MKRIILTLTLALGIIALAFPILRATADKPQDVIQKSNGFPSGMHFNLNIHGKKWVTCNAFPEEDGNWGNSIFIPEYGAATIEYISNKKSSVYNLTVLDPCGGFDSEDDVARVQLPYKIEVDGQIIPSDGFYVFGRILGKPNNGNNNMVSTIILYPNVIKEACNDDPNNPDPDFGGYTSCDEVPLGVIVGENLYIAKEEVYERFNSDTTKGRGKSKATDMTRLFTYTGWAIDARLDLNTDGMITEADIPSDAYDIIITACESDKNCIDACACDSNCIISCEGGLCVLSYDDDSNCSIDLNEWLIFQQDQGMAWYLEEKWIFEVADLVVTEQGLVNDGTKLLQIRFYPVATTEFTP